MSAEHLDTGRQAGDPTAPLVSILLPTWNGERDLVHLLPALSRQSLTGGFELRVIDSSSQDGTVALLKKEAARVAEGDGGCVGIDVQAILRSEFHHGRTRNRLANQARGQFLVFLSQDAIPQGTDFLQRLLAPFENEQVAGVTARVLPREGDDPLTARTVLQAPEASTSPQLRSLDHPLAFDQMSGAERADILRFNNVASAIRASVFQEIPFPDVFFGEDFAWASRALAAGWKTAFEPGAVVRHSHRYSPRAAFERYRVDAAFHRRLHGHHVRRGPWGVLRGVAFELMRDAAFVMHHREGGWHLFRAPGLRTGQVLGQWFGSCGWGGWKGADDS